MNTFIVFTIALLCLTLSASATTRYVSAYGEGQYTTLSAAYTAAVNGDTILIGPGVYTEGNLTSTKRLAWVGAGWDKTNVIFSAGPLAFQNTSASRSLVEGLWIQGYTYALQISNSADSVTVRRCRLGHTYTQPTYYVIEASGGGRIYVEDCIITQYINPVVYFPSGGPDAVSVFRGCIFAGSNYQSGACFQNTSGSAAPLDIYNCVFLNCRTIFSVTGYAQPVFVVNNIFYDWGSSPTFGTYPASSTFDYNASQTVAAPGTNTVNIVDNPFVNYYETANYQEGISDLHLLPWSGLVDTGHPAILDPDSSRSDFGVYGGPHPLVDNGVPTYPWALNIILNPNLVGQGTDVNASALGRIGPQY
jgi:hypothetical protein